MINTNRDSVSSKTLNDILTILSEVSGDHSGEDNSYIRHGDHLSSEKINEAVMSSYKHIAILMNELENIKKEMREQKVIQNVNFEFYKRRITALTNENDNLKKELSNANKFNKTISIGCSDFKSFSNKAYMNESFDITTFYPDTVTPISYISTNAGPYLPDDTSINIIDGFTGEHYIENDRRNMIDDNIDTFWHREYHFDDSSSTTSVEVEVTIDMPYSSVNTYKFNNVQIRPYPFKAIDVLKVEYFYAGKWETIESNKLASENIYIQTDDKIIEKLRLTLRQEKSVLINGEKIFYVGLNNVLVSQIKSSHEEVDFHYDFMPKENMIINDIEAVFYNKSVFNMQHSFEYDICILSSDGYETAVDKTYPIYLENDKEYRIKFRLKKHNAIPVLEKINLKYSKNI